MGGETIKQRDHPHDEKISYLHIEDIFIQTMTEYELNQIGGDFTVVFVIHKKKDEKVSYNL